MIASLRRAVSDAPLYLILIAVVAVVALLSPDRFLRVQNLVNMAYQLPVLAFLSIGMMVTMLTGGINLAIVSAANFTGVVTALALKFMTDGNSGDASAAVTIAAMAIGLSACLASGALTGFLIAYLEVPAILATLGMMMLLNGASVVMTRGYTISDFPEMLAEIGNGTVVGVPIPFLLLIVAVLALHVLLNKMPFGFNLYMLGSNPVAARYSNINTRAVMMWQYLLSSLFSAVTAFIMMGQFNSVKANYAESYVLVTVLACFLGGVDPFGGSGRLGGLILAVVILQVISNGVNLLRVDPFFVTAMWGAIILVLIAANHFGQRWRSRHAYEVAARDRGHATGAASSSAKTLS
jgi:ribose/xylose/arabinose/galactoside ABC-type transport system permease subunit